ncbi:hypothetical protein MLOOGBEN_02215 [Bacillus sp. EB106-08-02-XG196]|uniref:DUF4359 domain-containing protein n=1 Tax=Bacillus sp. EB106-08-02-XG196 TaxID=2737049 RepID=UPI0015C49AC5|nr:DUF4359 domain-containing protein [Bacillus sp. EB106-08-02-XG196]NWQ39511.1 hypothetical protein [Bacillus sp. EB106-08-02-XG196]
MKKFISIILLIVIVFVLSETNPGRSEYIEWITHEAMDQSSNILEKGILSLAGEEVFDMGTTESDYFIFSVYKTDFSEIGLSQVTCIGFFNTFIPISKNEK